MAPQTQTQKQAMRTAWQFECKDEAGATSDCGYLIRDHVLPQLVAFTIRHVKDSHGVDVNDQYVRSCTTEVRF